MVSVRKLHRPSSEFLRRQVHWPYIDLLEYRNTPVTGMTYSPSQLFMSHVTRTKFPVTTELLQPKLVTEVYQQLKACQQRQVHYYNQGTKPLTTLELQEVVRLRQGKTWTPAISGRERLDNNITETVRISCRLENPLLPYQCPRTISIT